MAVASSTGTQRCLSWYLNLYILRGGCGGSFVCLLVFVEPDGLKNHEVLLGNLHHVNYFSFAVVS